MKFQDPRSTAKAGFAILLTFLLASTLATQLAQAQTFKVLHTFHGKDGGGPEGVLVRDAEGNLYGTAGGGDGKCGNMGCGTVFKMDKAGKQVWLYSFKGANGEGPVAGVLRDAAGNLFGTTLYGGHISCAPPLGCGVVFKLDKTGKEEVVLHKFNTSPDGNSPEALLVEDAAGNLYGSTIWGGIGYGTVFEVTPPRTEKVLYSFQGGSDGWSDYPGVILGPARSLYGVAETHPYGAGVVFELDSAGNETVLYGFTGGADGGVPDSVLLEDSAGNLYGTTEQGGNSECTGGAGCGVVFKLSPQSGGGWSETVLYTFCSLSNCADGAYPGTGPLVMDPAGNLYGTTYFGGTYDDGVVFKLDTAGNETILHTFTGGADGGFPNAGLIRDNAGNLYGTASGGGATCYTSFTCGVVFKITP